MEFGTHLRLDVRHRDNSLRLPRRPTLIIIQCGLDEKKTSDKALFWDQVTLLTVMVEPIRTMVDVDGRAKLP